MATVHHIGEALSSGKFHQSGASKTYRFGETADMGKSSKQGGPMHPNRLREIRERVGLTQDELAEKTGTTPQHVSRIELGDRKLTQGWMIKFSDAPGVKQADFLIEGAIPGSNPGSSDSAKRLTQRRLAKFWEHLEEKDQDLVLAAFDLLVRHIGKS